MNFLTSRIRIWADFSAERWFFEISMPGIRGVGTAPRLVPPFS